MISKVWANREWLRSRAALLHKQCIRMTCYATPVGVGELYSRIEFDPPVQLCERYEQLADRSHLLIDSLIYPADLNQICERCVSLMDEDTYLRNHNPMLALAKANFGIR